MPRSWHFDQGALSRRLRWAASKHEQGGQPFVRPRSEGALPICKRVATHHTGGQCRWYNSRASSRIRRATDLSTSSMSPGNSSSSGLSLRLDGTAAPKNAPKSAAPAISCGASSHPSGESSRDRIEVTEMQCFKTTAEVDLQSSPSASCFTPSVAKEKSQTTGTSYEGNHGDHTNLENRDPRREFVPLRADTISWKTNTIRETDRLQRASTTRRPFSAGVTPAPTRSTQFTNQSEGTSTRSRTALERDPTFISGKGPFNRNAVDTRESVGRQEPGKRVDSVEKIQGSDLHGIGSSIGIGGTVSVEVVLPQLEQRKGIEDRRIRPGSAIEGKTTVRIQAGNQNAHRIDNRFKDEEVDGVPKDVDVSTSGIASRLAETAFVGALSTREARLDTDEPSDRWGGHDDADRESTARPILQPRIGVLGHFVGESWGKSRSSLDSDAQGKTSKGLIPVVEMPFDGDTVLHTLVARSLSRGPCESDEKRALASNNRSREASLRKPDTPAVLPGRQPLGATHPLSPMSLDSPPRRHRNSNWGEEGEPLAEEEGRSRETIPYVVSETVLGWKLSTRGRKKTLEDSLKASNYSEHHLIPVYGFRCEDAMEGVAPRERRLELKRVEARALSAEREALKRRTRAEWGKGGAAFARTVSRRALARADWIQKMGDVQDARDENLRRGSTPEVVGMYRKHVRDRIRCVRLRKRAERGLSLRRPTRICAVTSRADLLRGRESSEDRRFQKDSGASKGDRFMRELAQEPYVMLVRARRRLDLQEECKDAPFCGECLGGCKGTCLPGSRSYVSDFQKRLTKGDGSECVFRRLEGCGKRTWSTQVLQALEISSTRRSVVEHKPIDMERVGLAKKGHTVGLFEQ